MHSPRSPRLRPRSARRPRPRAAWSTPRSAPTPAAPTPAPSASSTPGSPARRRTAPCAPSARCAPAGRVVPLSPQMIGLRFSAAARAAGLERRVTAHSGRVGLASELTSRGASTTDVMLAGNWKTSRMVAHYSAGATAERGAVARYPVDVPRLGDVRPGGDQAGAGERPLLRACLSSHPKIA